MSEWRPPRTITWDEVLDHVAELHKKVAELEKRLDDQAVAMNPYQMLFWQHANPMNPPPGVYQPATCGPAAERTGYPVYGAELKPANGPTVVKGIRSGGGDLSADRVRLFCKTCGGLFSDEGRCTCP